MIKSNEEKTEKNDKIETLEKKIEIVNSFGPHFWKTGFGHYFGNDARSVRKQHNETSVRRVLRAMEAGFMHFNLKFESASLEVQEGDWHLNHHKIWNGKEWDKNWKLTITKNSKKTSFSFIIFKKTECDIKRREIMLTTVMEDA
jgi:hypothetical protein